MALSRASRFRTLPKGQHAVGRRRRSRLNSQDRANQARLTGYAELVVEGDVGHPMTKTREPPFPSWSPSFGGRLNITEPPLLLQPATAIPLTNPVGSTALVFPSPIEAFISEAGVITRRRAVVQTANLQAISPPLVSRRTSASTSSTVTIPSARSSSIGSRSNASSRAKASSTNTSE